MLCGLYVAQGVPFGFVTITLAAALAAAGATADDIGKVIALSTLPWALKWIAGPFVDRFTIVSMGRRRPWILLGQAGMVLTLVAMALIPDPTAQISLLGGLSFTHSCFNALQDVSVDALAVDLLPPEERGRVTGFMYGSKYAGTAIGGAGLAIVSGAFGLPYAFGGMIIIVLLLSVLPLLMLERPWDRLFPWSKAPPHTSLGDTQCADCRYPLAGLEDDAACPECGSTNREEIPRPVVLESPPPGTTSFGQLFVRLGTAFMTRAAALTAVMMLVERAASAILSPIGTKLFVMDLGWGQAKYGTVTGGYAVVAGLTGAIAGGFLADRFGPRRVAAIATVGFGCLLMGFGFAEELWANNWITIPYLVVESFLQGAFATSLFAICLGVSNPAVAATQFTAYMAMSNLSTTWGSSISGWVESTLGIPGAFLAAGILQASIVLILPLTFIKRPPEALS